MLKRSHLTKVVALLMSFPLMGVAELKTPPYPAIKEWQGQAWITGKDGKRQVLRTKLVLRDKALVETSLLGQVKVQLDEKRSLTLLGDSAISLPVISWETGESPILILKRGEFQWQQDLKAKGAYNVAVRSDLFEFILPPGKYTLSVYPEKAFAGVKVFEGSLEFSALNGDESATVKAGQQVGFQGVLEGGEIAYDVLLKGKKIPRGHLASVSSIDATELTKAAEADRKLQQSIARKKKAAQMVIDTLKREGVICQDPPAKFNECAWVCLNNPKKEKKVCLVGAGGASCVRRRCNANGVWADETVLDAEKSGNICKAQSVVAPCDY